MKKCYALLTFLCACVIGYAQPSLTSSNMLPVIGKTYTVHQITPAANAQGAGGANQTWSFPNTSSTTVAYQAVAPSSTPYGSTFPTSNLCIQQGASYDYSLTSSNSVSKVGLRISSTESYVYSDPEKILSFPFTFNSTFTDAYKATINYSTIQGIRHGSVTVTADGYGNITTPARPSPFLNALRVHVQETVIDTLITVISPPQYTINTGLNNYYIWYIAGTHYPVFQLSYLETNGVANNTGFYLDYNSTAVDEALAASFNFSVFPNPASESAHVKFELKGKSDVQLILLDMLGNTVALIQQAELPAGSYEFPVETASLSEGIYFLHAVFNDRSFDTKVLVGK